MMYDFRIITANSLKEASLIHTTRQVPALLATIATLLRGR